ncbi:hypothetical protein E2C01_077651 [Portunus trituberculatus]|uniref:Uncharacterized protein n=1 Tax=Portunus trituberculatus TaxID=210409 RepID=A0A5B7IGK2_PORTR|nr:hypothetical protein [Portunus trituberculatus]
MISLLSPPSPYPPGGLSPESRSKDRWCQNTNTLRRYATLGQSLHPPYTLASHGGPPLPEWKASYFTFHNCALCVTSNSTMTFEIVS